MGSGKQIGMEHKSPGGIGIDVQVRLFLSEVCAIGLLLFTLLPYLVASMQFSAEEVSIYLPTVLVTAVANVVGSYYSVRYLTRPIRRLLYLQPSKEDDPEILGAARVAALNLPIQFTMNVLVRYISGATVIALLMLLTGTLSWERTAELWTKAIIGLLIAVVFMFFVCERILWPVRRYIAVRCRGLRELGYDRILKIGVQTRLLVVVLLMVALPLIILSSLYYDALIKLGITTQLGLLRTITLSVLVVSLAIAGTVAFLLARSIAEPLRRAATIMQEVGAGNLALRVDVLSSDETGTLGESFNRMVDQLEESQNLLREANRQITELNRDLEQKIAERTRELREAANRNRIILESIGDGLIVFDARQRAVMANPAVQQVLGLSAEEVLGQHVDSILARDSTPEERDRSLAILAGLLAAGRGMEQTQPVLVKFRQGERFITANFAPIGSAIGDLEGGMVAVFRDTTRMEKMTAELERTNAELMLANRHKSEFLANMSHELRTPLNAIIGFSELLREETYGPLNAKQARYVENIRSSGEHLLRLINDILDLSKIEAGKLKLECRSFSVVATLEDIYTTMKPMAERKGLAMELVIEEGIDSIYADESKFRQIMYNLLSNAIKFTDQGRVDIRASNDGPMVRFAVRDTGIGIKEEDLRHLFKEFQQLDSSYSRRYGGTGLGLALSKKLVEMQGGNIWVEGTFGVGSTFAFTLPRTATSKGMPEKRKASDVAALTSSQNLILVVEDDREAAELLSIYLSSGGYSVIRAADGEEALQYARRLKPMAILLDILLPTIDGWSVLRQLKLCEDTKDIPVMIVSVVDNRNLGFSLGAVEYLVKPVTKEELLKRVERLRPRRSISTQVLVIDDDPLTLELLTETLSPEGYKVLTAGTGIEGIQMAESMPMALAIVDLMLPDITGIEVVHRMRGKDATKDLPVIMFTARDLTPQERDLLNDKIYGISSKGRFSREAFLEEVKRAIGWHPTKEAMGANLHKI